MYCVHRYAYSCLSHQLSCRLFQDKNLRQKYHILDLQKAIGVLIEQYMNAWAEGGACILRVQIRYSII